MGITIKTIRIITLTNIAVLGLAACSSSPAPWTKQNDSPWGAKYSAQEQEVPSDDMIADEPVLLDEPEPVMMDEPAPVVEPVAAPVVIAEPMREMTTEEKVMAMPGSSFAIQVYASKTPDSAERFKADHNLNDLMMVKTERSGGIVYVLIEVRPDRATANAAAVDIEAATGSKPWVRSLSGVQKIIAQ